MSYLLKALKKAEEERLSLKEDANAQSPVVIEKQSVLPLWLVVMVCAFLVATIWKLFVAEESTRESSPSLGAAGVEVSTEDERGIEVATMNEKIKISGSVSEAKKNYQLKVGEILIGPHGQELVGGRDAAEISTGSNVRVLDEAMDTGEQAIKQLAELGKGDLARIPSLALESHLYSSVAKYSSVIINGGTYAEGDYINSEIVIKKINAEGIILSLGDLLVELPKGITWVSTNHAK